MELQACAMTCATHHHACDCREEKIKALLLAAKLLSQSHLKCMALSFPVNEDMDEEFDHFRAIAWDCSDKIQRLWKELK